MLGIIRDKNLEITNDPSEADIIIVNTVASLKALRKNLSILFCKWQNIKKKVTANIVVTGCLGQRYADELFAELTEVDAIVGKDSFTDIGMVMMK